jgi:Tfp pilus assembly protein PilZ
MAKQEKRGGDRTKKRVMVRYGVDAANRTAFTKNLSETGVFLQTNSVFKPGSTIQVQIELDERSFNMWARVAWAKKVPPQLAHILDCGMGLCFIDPSPEWLEYFNEWRAKHGG